MGNGCSTILTSEVIHNIENKKESYDYKLYKRKVKHNSNNKTKKHKHKTPIITSNSIIHNDSTTINHNIKQLEKTKKKSFEKLLPAQIQNTEHRRSTCIYKNIDHINEDKYKVNSHNNNNNNNNSDNNNVSDNSNSNNSKKIKNNSDQKKIAILNSYIEDLEGELTDYSMQMVKMKLDNMNNDKQYKEQIKKLKSKNGKLFKSYIELKQSTNSY
jgi:hypothetical protein